MKSYQIHIDDWHRILFGQVPGEFYIELIIRALFVYFILMGAMRVMGKRMSSQLSRNELAALVSLAAAIGMPLMTANRGLLPPVIIAIIVVTIQRLIASWSAKSQSFEALSQGNISSLISGAVIQVNALSSVGISREQLFAQLRAKSITHLGYVERLYMEANGSFTLVKFEDAKPGLCVLPVIDKKFSAELKQADFEVCVYCGACKPDDLPKDNRCPNCNHELWIKAVSDK